MATCRDPVVRYVSPIYPADSVSIFQCSNHIYNWAISGQVRFSKYVNLQIGQNNWKQGLTWMHLTVNDLQTSSTRKKIQRSTRESIWAPKSIFEISRMQSVSEFCASHWDIHISVKTLASSNILVNILKTLVGRQSRWSVCLSRLLTRIHWIR